jgi:UcrQ family
MLKGLIYNGANRSSRYWFYWLPPTVGFYYLYKWLKEKYVGDKGGGLMVGMNIIIPRPDMLIWRD